VNLKFAAGYVTLKAIILSRGNILYCANVFEGMSISVIFRFFVSVVVEVIAAIVVVKSEGRTFTVRGGSHSGAWSRYLPYFCFGWTRTSQPGLRRGSNHCLCKRVVSPAILLVFHFLLLLLFLLPTMGQKKSLEFSHLVLSTPFFCLFYGCFFCTVYPVTLSPSFSTHLPK
jgi:hypothetical protein